MKHTDIHVGNGAAILFTDRVFMCLSSTRGLATDVKKDRECMDMTAG